jgi:hypothetical protein
MFALVYVPAKVTSAGFSLSMAELAVVRAEIKAWERTFKEQHGRAATVDDVRQNDAMGASNSI